MGRLIGLDVHRGFCEVAVAEGGRARSAGRVVTSVDDLELFAASLAADDRVVLEATGNALAIARLIEPHVGEVVLANARQLKAISHARVKTDKVDARVLADLLSADLIPPVWIGDERVRMLRRLVSRRRGLVKCRTQVKNEISAVLHRNLKGRPPVSDPFGRKGRLWLAAQELPADERLTVDAGLRQLDFLGAELAEIDRLVAMEAQGDEDVRRLLTIPGVDVTTAVTLIAVIGDVSRFPTSRQLVGYLGLHPACASRAAGRTTTAGCPRRARRRLATSSSKQHGAPQAAPARARRRSTATQEQAPGRPHLEQ